MLLMVFRPLFPSYVSHIRDSDQTVAVQAL